jgi:Zn-finger nucleic acid-binding protein
MICPVCKIDMLVMEYQNVELELLFASIGLAEEGPGLKEMVKPAGKVKEKPRQCSICRRRMEKVILGSNPGVLIDRCVNNDGLWFDAGELNQALAEFADRDSPAVGNIFKFLGEAFPAKQDPKGE